METIRLEPLSIKTLQVIYDDLIEKYDDYTRDMTKKEEDCDKYATELRDDFVEIWLYVLEYYNYDVNERSYR